MEKPFAWTELEARFAKVMRQNAELTEQNELLDHIIQQLQCENDTIGKLELVFKVVGSSHFCYPWDIFLKCS